MTMYSTDVVIAEFGSLVEPLTSRSYKIIILLCGSEREHDRDAPSRTGRSHPCRTIPLIILRIGRVLVAIRRLVQTQIYRGN
jgi:hypothetical protein